MELPPPGIGRRIDFNAGTGIARSGDGDGPRLETHDAEPGRRSTGENVGARGRLRKPQSARLPFRRLTGALKPRGAVPRDARHRISSSISAIGAKHRNLLGLAIVKSSDLPRQPESINLNHITVNGDQKHLIQRLDRANLLQSELRAQAFIDEKLHAVP